MPDLEGFDEEPTHSAPKAAAVEEATLLDKPDANDGDIADDDVASDDSIMNSLEAAIFGGGGGGESSAASDLGEEDIGRGRWAASWRVAGAWWRGGRCVGGWVGGWLVGWAKVSRVGWLVGGWVGWLVGG